MTPTLAPGLLMGSAPPAHAPPGVQPSSPPRVPRTEHTSGGGDGSVPEAFAVLLQAATQQGSGTQSGGKTVEPATPPTGGTPSTPKDAPTVTDLLAQLMALAQGRTDQDSAAPADQPAAMQLLLDRLAGAGGIGDLVGSASALEDALDAGDGLEALMAYLVMGQPPVAPDAVTALPDDLVALLEQIEGDVNGLSTAVAPDAEVDAGPVPSTHAGQGAAAVPAPEVTETAAGIAPVADEGGDALLAPAPEDPLMGPTGGVAGEPDVPAPGAVRAVGAGIAETPQGEVTVEARLADQLGGQGGDAPTGTAPAGTAPAGAAANASTAGGPETAMAAAPAASQPAVPPSVEPAGDPRVVNASTLPTELADTVRVAAFRGDSEVRLVLNPPELGHLDIHISRGEQGLRITLEASQASARELIDRSLAGLHQALEARDLRVDRLEVRATDAGRGSLDTSAGGQQSGGGAFGGSSDGEASPEWSPVTRFEPATEAAGAVDRASSEGARGRAEGSVDVLA